jgi:hypothetical protein
LKADIHGNEPQKHSNSEERDNSNVEGVVSMPFDQNLPQGEN